MASERRLGSPESHVRALLLEAAERLMRTEGHGAVTVRRLAEEAGVKRQLVHYYFRTMEELYSAVVSRVVERYLARMEQIRDARNPMRALWEEFFFVPDGIRLEIELMGLGNHFEAVRAQLAEAMERSRNMQVDAVRQQMAGRTFATDEIAPEAAVLILRSVARGIIMEATTGATQGHDQATAAVEYFLRQFDRDPEHKAD